jgi:glycine reductase
MRLDVGSFPVSRAEIGARTSYAGGLLTVGHEAVRRLVLRDPRIRDVTLELVHPGDSVRVLRALDAIEPLVKVRGPGSAFPGFNGPPVTGGSGGSHRLEGFAVVEVTDFPFPARGVQAFEEGIIEMSGPGAVYSGCADRVCLCLVLTPGSVSRHMRQSRHPEPDGPARARDCRGSSRPERGRGAPRGHLRVGHS